MTGIYEKEGAERLAHQDSLALSVGGEKQKLVNEGRILLELELRCLAAHLSHLQCNTTVHRFTRHSTWARVPGHRGAGARGV